MTRILDTSVQVSAISEKQIPPTDLTDQHGFHDTSVQISAISGKYKPLLRLPCNQCNQWEIITIFMHEDEITYQIRGAIYDTYNTLGPGLLESVYEEVLIYYLSKRGLFVERQVEVPIEVDNFILSTPLRLDLLVEKTIIIEIKSVTDMRDLFHKQILTYLKLTGLHRGILVNFNTADIQKSIWNKVNGHLEIYQE